MEKVPELTKEEYIRLELTKAYIASRPNYGASAIKGEIEILS